MVDYTLITGASSGIGKEFALQYAKKGRPLILVARSKEALEKLAQELRERFSISVHVFAQDLAKIESAETLFQSCKSLNLRVNFIINNAGFGFINPFETQEVKKIEEMILLNVLTLTKLSALFLPHLEQTKGILLNVASNAGFQPVPYMSVYAATKAYVLNFSEALFIELKSKGILVLTLAPGPTNTAFFEVANSSIKNSSFNLSVEKVVEKAIEGIEKKRRLTITGNWNRFSQMASRLLPRSLTLKISTYLMRKKGGHLWIH